MARKCILKRFWETGTPYIQMGGYLIVVCGFIMTVLAAAGKVEAFDDRLTANEQAIVEVRDALRASSQENKNQNDKLDLAIRLLQERRR